jgi:hypothetical protein
MPKPETDQPETNQPETEMQRQFAQQISNIRFRLHRLAGIENSLSQTDDAAALKDLRLYQKRLSRLLRAYTAEHERLQKDGSVRLQTTLWSNIPQA